MNREERNLKKTKEQRLQRQYKVRNVRKQKFYFVKWKIKMLIREKKNYNLFGPNLLITRTSKNIPKEENKERLCFYLKKK